MGMILGPLYLREGCFTTMKRNEHTSHLRIQVMAMKLILQLMSIVMAVMRDERV